MWGALEIGLGVVRVMPSCSDLPTPFLSPSRSSFVSVLQWFLEIMPLEANKGYALRTLCAHLDIDPNDAVAFGDGANDLGGLGGSMLCACRGLSPSSSWHPLFPLCFPPLFIAVTDMLQAAGLAICPRNAVAAAAAEADIHSPLSNNENFMVDELFKLYDWLSAVDSVLMLFYLNADGL